MTVHFIGAGPGAADQHDGMGFNERDVLFHEGLANL